MDLEQLRARATAWLEHDPDPWTRAATQSLLGQDTEHANAELKQCFGSRLQFGTAGIRGVLGPGPGRMNRALVRQVTAGLASYLLKTVPDAQTRGIVVGHDARRGSVQFARDTASVLSGAGFRVLRCAPQVPTPFVAFVARQTNAAAAIVVTASHNPPQYNGYKVYWENGAQIIPPHDEGIAKAIEAVDQIVVSEDLVEDVHGSFVEKYLEAIRDQIDYVPRPTSPKAVKVVYTPLHGVGATLCEAALRAEGVEVVTVPEQREPDESFPTVAFPNPEEDGALDLAMETAERHNADIIMANDPDADRLAAVVKIEDVWRPLTGDELGVVFADALLDARGKARIADEHAFVMNSIVSSELVARVASHYGASHYEVLTGFKWIWNGALDKEANGGTYVFGYEEALGYSVGPAVRDKDGISAALLLARLAQGETSIFDRLRAVWSRHGYVATRQISHVDSAVGGQDRIRSKMAAFRQVPVTEIAGVKVDRTRDLIDGLDGLAPHDCLTWWLADETRVMVRPSGTEPKLKVYFQVVESWGEGAEQRATQRLDELQKSFMGRYFDGFE